MTDVEWSRAICKVDAKELAAWMQEHVSDLDLRAFSTKRDNYGLTGKKSPAKKNHFAIGAKAGQ